MSGETLILLTFPGGVAIHGPLDQCENGQARRYLAGMNELEKAKTHRRLLIPGQWRGSVEHSYHFLLGYLLPIVTWLEDRNRPACTLRDCGPMNSWLDLITTRYDVELMPPGLMLHALVKGRTPHVVLPPLDDPAQFHGPTLRTFAREMNAIAGATVPRSRPHVVVLKRGRPDPYYQDPRTE